MNPNQQTIQESVITHRVNASRVVISVLSSNHIVWGVMHGAEGFPNQVGRDLDLLVDSREHHSQALQIAKKLDSEGWRTTIIKRPWGVTQIIASRLLESGITIAFETDLVARQVWCGIPLAVGPPQASELLEIEQGMQIALWGGFVKALLIQCLAGNWSKMTSRRHEWLLDPHQESIVKARLTQLVGRKSCADFLAALKSGDDVNLRKATAILKRQLLTRHAFHPISILIHGTRWLYHRHQQRTASVPRAPLLLLDNPHATSEQLIYDSLSTLINQTMVFPGFKILPFPSCTDTKQIKLQQHWSANGILIVHIFTKATNIDHLLPWFPSPGIAQARITANLPDDLTTILMNCFHNLNQD
jgi:hypothetical protein